MSSISSQIGQSQCVIGFIFLVSILSAVGKKFINLRVNAAKIKDYQTKNLKSVFGGRHRKTDFYRIFGLGLGNQKYEKNKKFLFNY